LKKIVGLHTARQEQRTARLALAEQTQVRLLELRPRTGSQGLQHTRLQARRTRLLGLRTALELHIALELHMLWLLGLRTDRL